MLLNCKNSETQHNRKAYKNQPHARVLKHSITRALIKYVLNKFF